MRRANIHHSIFTATPDADNPPPLQDALCPINCPAINHRMFVLEGSESDPWAAEFTLKSQLNSYDQFAIDGTYFVYESKLYHIYSCWENTYSSWPANLCITSMSDPWTVSSNFSDRRMVSQVLCIWKDMQLLTEYNRSVCQISRGSKFLMDGQFVLRRMRGRNSSPTPRQAKISLYTRPPESTRHSIVSECLSWLATTPWSINHGRNIPPAVFSTRIRKLAFMELVTLASRPLRMGRKTTSYTMHKRRQIQRQTFIAPQGYRSSPGTKMAPRTSLLLRTDLSMFQQVNKP